MLKNKRIKFNGVRMELLATNTPLHPFAKHRLGTHFSDPTHSSPCVVPTLTPLLS
jgi:hypothetical protein